MPAPFTHVKASRTDRFFGTRVLRELGAQRVLHDHGFEQVFLVQQKKEGCIFENGVLKDLGEGGDSERAPSRWLLPSSAHLSEELQAFPQAIRFAVLEQYL
jgi:hypothetical protein